MCRVITQKHDKSFNILNVVNSSWCRKVSYSSFNHKNSIRKPTEKSRWIDRQSSHSEAYLSCWSADNCGKKYDLIFLLYGFQEGVIYKSL